MTIIYGECVSGSAHAAVIISQLAADSCRLELRAAQDAPAGELTLWIGAVGPFEIRPFGVTAAHGNVHSVTARFKHPLEPAIIAHFDI